jgi:hypothetical protein
LHTLYTSLSTISLTNTDDIYAWRWNNNDIFNTNSCYLWLEFGDIINLQFQSTWPAHIALKIKKNWLVK